MINGLQGIPGSGKSYEACVYHVLAAVKAGRKVITNLPLQLEMWGALDPSYPALIELRWRPQPVRGTFKADRVDDQGNGQAFILFEDSHTEPAGDDVPVFGHVWDYWSDWKHPTTGSGPLFIVDECHVAMPKIGTDKDVVKFYKLHRHFNVDILLMTQSFREMCLAIAEIMAVLIKTRKADILGRADHYVRKVHGGYRGAVISTEERKYLPQYFALYKSHTNGNSVMESFAQDVAPFIVSFQRYNRYVWVLFGVCLVGLVVWFLTKPNVPKSGKVKTTSVGPPPGYVAPVKRPAWLDAPAAAASAPEATSTAKIEIEQPTALDDIAEPYQGKTLHLNGFITMKGRTVYNISVAQNGVVVSHVTDLELARAGYTYRSLSDCSGVVTWRRKSRTITCDTPQLGMAGNAPVSAIKG